MSELKPCPVCKGQSGGIGSDGVENDCAECFIRDMKAATPRVEACIDSVMARFTGESKAALARYYEEVHQHLAPLARSLELELAEVKAELSRRPSNAASAQVADRVMLMPDDMKALKRFFECCDDPDSGGHDVSKDRMARLREIGVVESKGFGRHQITAFGGYALAVEAGEPVFLPLMTYADYEAKSKAEHEAKLAAIQAKQSEVD